jgi:hypothetical protein
MIYRSRLMFKFKLRTKCSPDPVVLKMTAIKELNTTGLQVASIQVGKFDSSFEF